MLGGTASPVPPRHGEVVKHHDTDSATCFLQHPHPQFVSGSGAGAYGQLHGDTLNDSPGNSDVQGRGHVPRRASPHLNTPTLRPCRPRASETQPRAWDRRRCSWSVSQAAHGRSVCSPRCWPPPPGPSSHRGLRTCPLSGPAPRGRQQRDAWACASGRAQRF